ncbi:UDP-N-acetylgalactosamine-undecaprenyl-phosphate N-acetylgalactosaminephosphotransferase [bacterium HR19]|nr:UDP-N-acetylgalactosamine-undecaprenyl-phosphate N-acetylgalactosaminephosphotransferase [bacterium HR19]
MIIAILIKLDSPGPIIFSHERVGKGGKKFKCYKFRTMYVDNEKILEEHFKKHPEDREYFLKTGKIPGRDPRITRLGRFLRKFSLDELPQIINVLKGDMSLVGPRALIEDEVKQCQDYYMEWAKYIKPGITGLAQVMGRANISHIDKNILSIWYMKNWSLWLDVIIIFKTIKVVLKTEGAY